MFGWADGDTWNEGWFHNASQCAFTYKTWSNYLSAEQKDLLMAPCQHGGDNLIWWQRQLKKKNAALGKGWLSAGLQLGQKLTLSNGCRQFTSWLRWKKICPILNPHCFSLKAVAHSKCLHWQITRNACLHFAAELWPSWHVFIYPPSLCQHGVYCLSKHRPPALCLAYFNIRVTLSSSAHAPICTAESSEVRCPGH